MSWLLRYNASAEIIWKHISMLHHQEINKLKFGGEIFSKIWFPVTYLIQ